jgi:class 3 adenylate cyclase
MIILTSGLLMLFSLVARGQGSAQLKLTRELLDLERYEDAAQVAGQALQNGRNAKNTAVQAEARILQARAFFGKETANSMNWRQKIRVKRALKAAEQLLENLPNDTLTFQYQQLVRRLNNKPPVSIQPGGVAQRRPTMEELKQRKLDVIRAVGDSILSLKKEREAFEKEVQTLTDEQARQELLLARQQQTIDSISLARLEDSIMVIRQEQQLQAQEAQLQLQRTQRNRSRIVAGAIILIALILTWLYLNSRRKNKIINTERERSDELLLNILPASVAQELKTDGQATARYYDEVTVLFSDFKDFSRISKDLTPAELVEALDRCFKAFDEIAEAHGIEKIKTIGDAYMAAAGVPESNPDDAHRAVQAALAMQDWLEQQKDLPFSGARIGLHTGPVVAGVVGARKFAYDIWGDTVNLAARLESKGKAGRVNISQATYDRISDRFSCTPRGKVPAKGIGEVEMYFVESTVAAPTA